MSCFFFVKLEEEGIINKSIREFYMKAFRGGSIQN